MYNYLLIAFGTKTWKYVEVTTVNNNLEILVHRTLDTLQNVDFGLLDSYMSMYINILSIKYISY